MTTNTKKKTNNRNININELNKVMHSYTTSSSYLEEENKLLKETVNQLKREIDNYKKTPLMVSEVNDLHDDNTAIIRIPNGNKFCVEKSNDVKDVNVGDTVLVEQKNLTIVKKINSNKNFDVEKFVIIEKPKVIWNEIGGLSEQINEVKEVVELPLKKPELFRKVGIDPPKGVLLYGPPGTGKTILAKAVANSTNSTFIEIVGSELVQKFIGEGAKLVKEVFQLAREKAPSIIFIDELDAIAATRVEIGTSGEREVQRTFMQLLSEIDGFDNLGNVKIIGATNRKDILDHAVIRPGRLDRLIHVDLPNDEAKVEILKIHTKRMNLIEDIDFVGLVKKMKDFSGAEIKAVCTEAGYFAIRKNETKVTKQDFLEAIEKIKNKEDQDDEDYVTMFG